MSPSDFRAIVFVASLIGISLSTGILFGWWAALGAVSVALLASLLAR